jgi:hypothetical protein
MVVVGAIVEPDPPTWRRVGRWYRSLSRRAKLLDTEDREPLSRWEWVVIFASPFAVLGWGGLAANVHWAFWIPCVLTLPVAWLFLGLPGSSGG